MPLERRSRASRLSRVADSCLTLARLSAPFNAIFGSYSVADPELSGPRERVGLRYVTRSSVLPRNDLVLAVVGRDAVAERVAAALAVLRAVRLLVVKVTPGITGRSNQVRVALQLRRRIGRQQIDDV